MKKFSHSLSRRIRTLSDYPFAVLERRVAELRSKGIRVIDLGVGSPTAETPTVIRRALKKSVDQRKNEGYPTYEGHRAFREGAANWLKKRFGVSLDPQTEITSCIGTKEAIFHLPEAFLDPGDIAICPSPGYSPYQRGTLFAEGKPFFLPLLAQNKFLPDLDTVPKSIANKAKILWINYPNNPTSAVAPPQFYRETVRFTRKYGIILCSDESYVDIYYKKPQPSALQFGKEGVISFFSLSKRSAMANYRIGFVAGDRKIIAGLRKVKTNADTGSPTFVQDAAIAALSDERHPEKMRQDYRKKRDILCRALTAAGFADCTPQATFYIWQRLPEGENSVAFAEKLLSPDVAIAVMPGTYLAESASGGRENPGEGYVRIALVAPLADIVTAAERISAFAHNSAGGGRFCRT
jgi:LL-diaminopimelate aminotransferase